MKKILYVRSGPYQVNPNAYNLQELGLARALYDLGYKCDIVYYHKKENKNEIIEKNGIEINILWRKGVRLLRSGIYPQILNKKFLKQYDIVICSEYSQIMSVLLCKYHNNVYIYNGPYYNLFKLPFIEKIYDKLFCNFINEKCKKVFCKTKLAEQYMNSKGITNTLTIGVGLDIENFNNNIEIKDNTHKILKQMENHDNLLYIGSIIKRKNVELIIDAFLKQVDINDNKQLIIIGKGNKKYQNHCCSIIPFELKDKVKWYDYVENSQTQFLYKKAAAFILPSIQEIFGMVLLESMYFGLPVISSNSAGGNTLIKNGINGVIINDFNKEEWSLEIKKVLEDKAYSKKLGEQAKKTIENEFLWNSIAKKIKNVIKKY